MRWKAEQLLYVTNSAARWRLDNKHAAAIATGASNRHLDRARCENGTLHRTILCKAGTGVRGGGEGVGLRRGGWGRFLFRARFAEQAVVPPLIISRFPISGFPISIDFSASSLVLKFERSKQQAGKGCIFNFLGFSIRKLFFDTKSLFY